MLRRHSKKNGMNGEPTFHQRKKRCSKGSRREGKMPRTRGWPRGALTLPGNQQFEGRFRVGENLSTKPKGGCWQAGWDLKLGLAAAVSSRGTGTDAGFRWGWMG